MRHNRIEYFRRKGDQQFTVDGRNAAVFMGVLVERENSSVESILSLAELCRFTTDFRFRRKKKKSGK